MLLRGDTQPSHRLWAQAPWRLPLLGDYWNLLPGAIQRHGALVLAWTIGRALSSPLFTQEREEPAGRRQADHSPEESLLSSQSLSVGHVRTVRLVNEFGPLSSSVRENPCRDSENERIRILIERQKEQILAEVRTEIQKHEFQADSDFQATSITTRTTIGTKSESSWSSYQKSSWDGRIEGSSRVTNRRNFEKKIDRKSGHYEWTHGKNSGITEWSQLYEWFERF